MLQTDSYVLHSTYGICLVEKIEKNKKVFDVKEDFYVLKSIDPPNSTVYIPTNNEAALSKIKPLLKKEEIQVILTEIKNESINWTEDHKKRQEEFSNTLYSSDRKELIKMIGTLYIRKNQLEKENKKLRYNDENALQTAEKKINSEFALVLGISSDDVPDFIKSHMN